VKEALQGVLTEVLNHPEPLNKLRPEPVVKASAAPPPATSVAEQGWLGRLAGVAQAAAGTVVHLTRHASARVAQVAPGWWKTIAAHLASGWRRLQMLWQGMRTYLSGLVGVAWQIRQPLLIALGVGSVLGLGCSVAGPVVAVTMSGLAGAAGALVVSAANALRRALASIKAQTT
jgi:hypothetical protein